jgi:hypothetical protein
MVTRRINGKWINKMYLTFFILVLPYLAFGQVSLRLGEDVVTLYLDSIADIEKLNELGKYKKTTLYSTSDGANEKYYTIEVYEFDNGLNLFYESIEGGKCRIKAKNKPCFLHSIVVGPKSSVCIEDYCIDEKLEAFNQSNFRELLGDIPKDEKQYVNGKYLLVFKLIDTIYKLNTVTYSRSISY